MALAYERAELVAVDTPHDDDPKQEVTLVLRYPDGTMRYVAVEARGMTTRMKQKRRTR